MTELKQKIDELSEINQKLDKLKERKSAIEAELLKQSSKDLENTKYKTIRYHGTKSDLVATQTESLKVIYPSLLSEIFKNLYGDVVDVKTTYSLSAPVTRMMIGLWKGNYIEAKISDVINQMNGVSYEEKKQLLKKLKGKNYDTDVKNILKFTSLSEQDAKEYAYMVAEAAVWQDFEVMLDSTGCLGNADESFMKKIQAAFVVEDGCKISLK